MRRTASAPAWPMLALLMLGLLPTAAAAATADRVSFGYLVRFIGLFDLTLDGAIELTGDSYVMTMDLRTEGMADMATRYRMSARSEGRHGSPVAAIAHDSKVNSRFIDTRRAKVRWDAEGFATAEMQPPPKSDDREPVARELTRGAIDPLSALLAGLLKSSPEAACAGRTPVFDGRRRYDLLPKPVGADQLEAIRAGAFAGAALHCELYSERIAGYSKKVDTSARKAGEPDFEVWFARHSGLDILMPVQIYADTRYGEVVANLVRVERNGRKIDLQAP